MKQSHIFDKVTHYNFNYMEAYLDKQDKAKSEYCIECDGKFRARSKRYYCCNKGLLVCESCQINMACKRCKKLRINKVVSCVACKKSKQQSDTFYDFKADCFVCSKCISNRYLQAYEHLVKINQNPKTFVVRIHGQSQYCIEELFDFFKKTCFLCSKPFDNNAYEMKFGARICEQCLKANFDFALDKLITCLQCGGCIGNLSQIKIVAGLTQVLCTYCAVDEVNIANFKEKKQQAGSTKPSKLKKRQSLKDNELIISVSQISKLKGKNHNFMKETLPEVMKARIIKVISRNSVEEQSLDITITVNRPTNLINCLFCNSKFYEKSLFSLTQQQLERLKKGKELAAKKKGNKICLMCFTQLSDLITPKVTDISKFQEIPSFFSNKELSPSLQVPSLHSLPTFPTSLKSPRVKIFAAKKEIQSSSCCQICNKEYGAITIDNKRMCLICCDNRNAKKW